MEADACVLACDTSSPFFSLALLERGRVTAEYNLLVHTGHSRNLFTDIQNLLTRRNLAISDITLLVCSLGPGSFTGVRIAMASLKGLAMALSVPLRGVCGLTALATPLCNQQKAVLAIQDARRNQVYAALYAPNKTTLIPPCVISPQTLCQDLRTHWPKGTIIAAGDGTQAYQPLLATVEDLIIAPPEANILRAAVLARLGLQQENIPLQDLQPLYIRREV